MENKEKISFRSCSEGAPRGCQISVGLGFARDVGKDAGVDTAYLDAILQRGETSEEEVHGALNKFCDSVPRDNVFWSSAQAVRCAVYPSEDCEKIFEEED